VSLLSLHLEKKMTIGSGTVMIEQMELEICVTSKMNGNAEQSCVCIHPLALLLLLFHLPLWSVFCVTPVSIQCRYNSEYWSTAQLAGELGGQRFEATERRGWLRLACGLLVVGAPGQKKREVRVERWHSVASKHSR